MITEFDGALAYDEKSPTGLTWLLHASTRARKGSPAGSDFQSRYWRIRLKGRDDLVHRVVWRIVNGPIPDGMEIDHIDGNGKNNRVSNLRLVECVVNQRNKRMSVRNVTGVNGVRYSGKSNGYEAFWNDLGGIKRTKFFSCQKYGQASAKRFAEQFRENAIAALNDSGAGYSVAHGLRRVYG